MKKLSDWLKRIRKVGYADEGRRRLRIGYDGGEDELVIKGKKGKRYVEMGKEGGYKGKYRLIEEQPKLGESDFKYCIFLVELECVEKNFEESIVFDFSVFTQKINFTECNFKKEIGFNKAVFQREANFFGVCFQEKAYFMEAHFQGKVYFGEAYFLGEANFRESHFLGEAYFIKTYFQEAVDFREAYFGEEANFVEACFKGKEYFGEAVNFEEEYFEDEECLEKMVDFEGADFERGVDFRTATIYGDINFTNSKIKSLIFSSVQEERNFSLNLKSAQIEKIDYTDTEFSKAENRDTYLLLKNLALKQDDRIRALDFYQKEMARHWAELEFLKHPIDKTILGIERWVSQYGTNPLLAAGWLILVNMILVIISQNDNIIFEQPWIFRFENLSWAWENTVLTEPFIGFLPRLSEEYSFGCFISLVLTFFLIYEVVRSLRRFSRKL